MSFVRHRHAWANRLQSAFLILFMLGLLALFGQMVLGADGLWLMLIMGIIALVLEPVAPSHLILRRYGAQPISHAAAPDLWMSLRTLAERAGLSALPSLHCVPSAVANSFAVGSAGSPAIVLSYAMLSHLSSRELVCVLAHEIAHIAHGDLFVMGLADHLSRLTRWLAAIGMALLFAALPLMAFAEVVINWSVLSLLLFAPHLSLLAQLGLSRTREYYADMGAAELTGDPEGLACALAHIEQASRGWKALLIPGLGSPEPSWLRTHPLTEDRIKRLLALRRAGSTGY